MFSDTDNEIKNYIDELVIRADNLEKQQDRRASETLWKVIAELNAIVY